VELVSVKGRPNQKLIENFFNRFWTRLSIELPYAQVGRYRDDDKLGQELYCKCRDGRADPRKYFPMLDTALAAIETSLRWLNTEPIQSPTFGKWVPVERWLIDMEQHPRSVAEDNGHLWLASPVLEERSVQRGMVNVTAVGPLGLKTPFHFSSPDLWTLEGKRVRVAFDPMQSPAIATIAALHKEEVLCEAVDVDPFAVGDTNPEVSTARALRAMIRREYRVLLPDKATGAQRIAVAETESRTTQRSIEWRQNFSGTTDTTDRTGEAPINKPAATVERRGGLGEGETARASRADVSRSLRRRAALVTPQTPAL
jgi:hypothetical protein